MRSGAKCIDDHRSQCSCGFGAHASVLAAIVAALAMIASSGCAKHVRVAHSISIGHTERGVASWYGAPYHGRKTANGEVYDMNGWTAAHRTMPFGTWVEVTNLTNRKRVSVRITDRGPFVHGRIIDLSRAAAQQIDMIGPGTARVHLRVIRAPLTEVGASQSYYAVQVASLTDHDEAEQLKQRFEANRQPAQLVERDVANEKRWRVLVGRESSLADATLLAVSLRAKYPDALVVRME